jgi:hypothetical protein
MSGSAYDRDIAQRWKALRDEQGDLSYADLTRRLDLVRAPEAGPSFDPTSVRYWNAIRDGLELTPEEQGLYRRWGLVGVDPAQRYTMASAYLAIYRRDLPVLITTDSILHALHRSFDNLLIELETSYFLATITEALDKAHAALRQEAPALAPSKLRTNAEDVDLYLTVARNLIAEVAAEKDKNAYFQCMMQPKTPGCDDDATAKALDGPPAIASALGQDAKVHEVLAAIRALKASDTPALYGSRGATVDWSQFGPRGHYSKTPALRRYFRTLMWLGRDDTGFVLDTPAAAFAGHEAARERTDAAMLAWLLRQSGSLDRLEPMRQAVSFLVGLDDATSPADLAAAAERSGVRGLADLGDTAKLDAVFAELARTGGGAAARIRSRVGTRNPGRGAEMPLAPVFQVFGQRFVIDSFLLSKLVFDSIRFEDELQLRTMPTGLDVAGALGNDEAVALLEPELTRWNYASNLLAARRVVEERPPEGWNGSLYDIWLSALTKLDDVPAAAAFPQVMRGRAWQRKELETQLASWAELRHDTILYVKQSYTMRIGCEYPAGYVEPYPELYARLGLFAEEANRRLGALKLASTSAAAFLSEFGGTVRRLEALARKELAGKPFSSEERDFVKHAIQAKTDHRGCGPPTITYSGWYPKLLYRGDPEKWEPTIADVHTDPNTGKVLEVGTGDANFVVVAIDNGSDRAAYVGPISSYYELGSPQRLTDEAWRARLQAGDAPARPDWTALWRGKPVARSVEPKKQ